MQPGRLRTAACQRQRVESDVDSSAQQSVSVHVTASMSRRGVCLYLCSCVMRKAIRFRVTSRATRVPATLNQDHLALRRLQPLMPSPGRLRMSIGSCPESPSHSCYANFTSIPVRLQPQISHWGMNLHASAISWPISRPRRLRPLFCKRARCSRIASPPLASHSLCRSVPSPLFSVACAEHESIP